MATYEVVRAFRDKDNEKHYYRKGDIYPVKGYEPSQARIDALLSDDNDAGEPLIEEVGVSDDGEYPKHTGGGWYELSNGEKIQGKDEAVEAENELK